MIKASGLGKFRGKFRGVPLLTFEEFQVTGARGFGDFWGFGSQLTQAPTPPPPPREKGFRDWGLWLIPWKLLLEPWAKGFRIKGTPYLYSSMAMESSPNQGQLDLKFGFSLSPGSLAQDGHPQGVMGTRAAAWSQRPKNMTFARQDSRKPPRPF